MPALRQVSLPRSSQGSLPRSDGLGLWLGGTASVADFASGVALIAGAIGVAIAAARLLRNRLYENRLRAMRERRDREDRFD